jgi:hypothetical protein
MAKVRYICGVTTPQLDVTARVRAACREGRADTPVTVDITREAAPRQGTPDTREAAPDPARTQPEAEREPKVVRIQCTDTHWCDFPCQPSGDIDPVVGVPVGTAEATIWGTWRDHADPLKGLARIEQYAKWVLGAAGIVTALAGSLAAGGVVKLDTTWAKVLYAIAIAFLGLSWAAISLSIAPKWIRVNRQSPSDFVEGFNAQYGSRRLWLSAAATALGLALLTAALVPLGDRLRDRPLSSAGIGYDVKENGQVTAQLAGAGLPPHTAVELVLQSGPPSNQALLRKRTLVDSDGKADVSVTLDSARAHSAAKPLLVTGRWMAWRSRGLVQKEDTTRVP